MSSRLGLGNTAFAAKEYDEAIEHYTAAIAIDPKKCIYYSKYEVSYRDISKSVCVVYIHSTHCRETHPEHIRLKFNSFSSVPATPGKGNVIRRQRMPRSASMSTPPSSPRDTTVWPMLNSNETNSTPHLEPSNAARQSRPIILSYKNRMRQIKAKDIDHPHL